MKDARRIRRILDLLNKRYGCPPRLVKSNPVDELVRTILSQNTNDRNSLAAFAILKENFKRWQGLLDTRTERIARMIRHAGLANIKAARIKGVLEEIRRREGRISLEPLRHMSVEGAIEYLRSLKGVGPKTAACVILFSFAKPAMPVDTHIFRVTKRLGLIPNNMNIEEAHETLSAMVPQRLVPRCGPEASGPCSGSATLWKAAGLIYNFHLGIIEHGRRTCKAQAPRCGACVLYRLCKFEKKKFFAKK